MKPFFKGMAVRAIGFGDIDEWRKKRGAVISARSHNIELETLRLIFAYGCDRGVLLDNPTEKFKREKQPKPIVEMLNRSEFDKIVKALRESPWSVTSGAADMVEFLAYSGTRVGEAREVRFRDVDFTANRLTITGGLGGTKNHEHRVIPLFPNLKNLLSRMFKERTPTNLHAPLFMIASPRGALAAACKRAGVRDFTVHSLRHFFATNALELQVTPKAVSEWLGHKDGGVLVLRTYGHLRQEFSMQEAEKMTFQAAVFSSSPQLELHTLR